ncbi:hypothetical protein VB738_14285 [Cyanobium gracile UHCC 0139]|uniref:Thioredoxin domain-containing protein n=1 Tax=Cyanobium gracile UHCC 0139 TaxID=3110308 RepID=A0ABU5RXI3_9CYAN|nr:hypothetical protein [Cyanobium gracile]MEA5392428.1 hypothetical protein [Cyanobium gracile UHCC 0139]
MLPPFPPRSPRRSSTPALLLLGGLSALAGGLLSFSPPAHGGQAGGSTTPTLGEALAPSSGVQLELTEHLRRIGAVFYGAWWCPACFRQKSLFGQQAGDRLPYVECDKTSEGRERCQAEGIKAYPTWVLGNKRVEGVQTIEELKRWSGFIRTTETGSP